MVDEAVDRSRDGGIFAAPGAQPDRRLAATSTLKPQVTLLRRRQSSACSTACAGASTARRSTPTLKFVKRRARARRRSTAASRSTPAALHKQIRAALVLADGAAPLQSRRPTHVEPKVTDRAARASSTRRCSSSTAGTSGSSSTRTSSRQDYTVAVGAGRPRDAGRALPHPEQGGEPRLARAQLRLGRRSSPARSSPAARRRTRSRRAGWASSTAPASTASTRRVRSLGHAASHGCVRMRIPDVEELYPQVPVGAPDLHRLAGLQGDVDPISSRPGPPPSRLQQGGMVVAVAKDQRADEDPVLLLAHHRVPHGRRVARALDPVPRPRARCRRAGAMPASISWRCVAT